MQSDSEFHNFLRMSCLRVSSVRRRRNSYHLDLRDDRSVRSALILAHFMRWFAIFDLLWKQRFTMGHTIGHDTTLGNAMTR